MVSGHSDGTANLILQHLHTAFKTSTVAPRDEERGGRSIVPSTFQHHIQLAASYQNVLQRLNTEDGTAVSLKRIILHFMKRLLLLLSTC